MEDPNDTSTWDIVKATQYGIFDRCKEIIERDGFDVRKPDKDNITVLHWAAINNRKDLVKYYLSAGAIIDAIGGDLNSTPLQWAVRQGHQSMIALLISNGADPTIRDGEGSAAIHTAAQYGFWPICAYLVAKGVDIDSYDTNGLTPLMWAVIRGAGPETIRVLIALGADPDLKDRKTHASSLHLAMDKGNEYAFRILLEKTKNLEDVNNKGISLLQLGTGKTSWMNEKLVHELEKRGLRRSRGIKRIISTHKRRMGFMFTLSLCFIIAVGYLFNTSNPSFSSWPIRLGCLIILYTIMFASLKYTIPGDEIEIRMPVCWSEATKLVITSTVLVQVWPALEFSTFHFLLYITMTPALHYVFYKVMHADPGIVPINKENQNNTIVELCEKDEMDSTTICTESMMKRPLRSKYDRFSKKLIAKFDHYCPWVNNAVGAGNHKFFVQYLLLLVLNLGWSAWAIGKYWSSPNGCDVDWSASGAMMKSFRCSGWITWVFANDVLYLVWVFMLLMTQLYFVIWKGITTNEQMRAGRYSYLTVEFGSIIHNAFDRGAFQNFIDFFEIDYFGFKPLKVDWRFKLDYGPEFKSPRFTTDEIV